MRVRVNTDHVLGLLLEKEQFNIARKYADLVNSTSSQISIKEVCLIVRACVHETEVPTSMSLCLSWEQTFGIKSVIYEIIMSHN